MKIAEGIYSVDGVNAHVYLFKAGDVVVQIDAGMAKYAGRVLGEYESLGIRPDAIVLTHTHMDHVGGLKAIYDLYRPAVYAHPAEIPVLTGARPPYSKGALMAFFSRLARPPALPQVRDVNSLSLPGVSVLETPGHTPGSITVILKREGATYAFVGDAAFEKEGSLYVNTRFSLDVELAKKSLEKIRGLAPAFVAPGHGNVVRIRET